MKKKELLSLIEVLRGRVTALEERVRNLERQALPNRPVGPDPVNPYPPYAPPFIWTCDGTDDPPTVRFTDNTASVMGPTGLQSGQGCPGILVEDTPSDTFTVPVSLVKSLRDHTGASMQDCKDALYRSTGDFDRASKYLHDKGQAISFHSDMNSMFRAGAENWPMGGPPIKEGTNI